MHNPYSARVDVQYGGYPAIIIAPHGFDDPNVGFMAQKIADRLDCFCVINNGWQCSAEFDYTAQKADCNSIKHCQDEVLNFEFLKPIEQMAEQCKANFGFFYCLILCGISDNIRRIIDRNLDLVIGWGMGSPPSLSCMRITKDSFISHLEDFKLTTYEAGSGSRYSGRKYNSLNQYVSTQKGITQSMQVGIVRHLRRNKDIAEITAYKIAESLKETVRIGDNYYGQVNTRICTY